MSMNRRFVEDLFWEFQEDESPDTKLLLEEQIKMQRLLEGQALLMRAGDLEIEIPGPKSKPEWWTSKVKEFPETKQYGEFILSDSGVAGVRRLIKDSRIERWRAWSQILVPVLSLLVALLALLKDVVVTVLRKYVG